MLAGTVTSERDVPARSEVTSRHVTILLAARNEATRLPRTLAALCELDYPSDRHRIVVADDGSTDATVEIVRAWADRRGTAVPVQVLTRPRTDASSKGEVIRWVVDQHLDDRDDLILVLDADHELEPTALSRVATAFQDPAVGAVAMRHVARPARPTTAWLYSRLEGSVSEEVTARGLHGLGLAPQLSGVWTATAADLRRHFPRRSSLVDDVDLTVALVRAGRRIVYVGDAVSRHDVPSTWSGYRRQHRRWSNGLTGSFIDVLRPTSTSPKPSLRASVNLGLLLVGYSDRLIVLAALPLAAARKRRAPMVLRLTLGLYAITIGAEIAQAAVRDTGLRPLHRVPGAVLIGTTVDILTTASGVATRLLGRSATWR